MAFHPKAAVNFTKLEQLPRRPPFSLMGPLALASVTAMPIFEHRAEVPLELKHGNSLSTALFWETGRGRDMQDSSSAPRLQNTFTEGESPPRAPSLFLILHFDIGPVALPARRLSARPVLRADPVMGAVSR